MVTELPPIPPMSNDDKGSLKSQICRELDHALATEARSYSKAMEAASYAVTRTDGSTGSGNDGPKASFRSLFAGILSKGSKQKSHRSSRSSGAPPSFKLRPEVSDEECHLKRADYQQAMDNVAQLRKQKMSGKSKGEGSGKWLPLVHSPPAAHPRFMPCRLILHLPALDASIRRALLFALTEGQWLPPDELVDLDLSSELPSFSSQLSPSVKIQTLLLVVRSESLGGARKILTPCGQFVFCFFP